MQYVNQYVNRPKEVEWTQQGELKMHDNDELLSLNEYASLIKQSRSNMYLLQERGEIPKTFLIGGRNFISKSRVYNWIAQRESLAAA
jgi:predicted DNA-binding transcriptional regulator AlpA